MTRSLRRLLCVSLLVGSSVSVSPALPLSDLLQETVPGIPLGTAEHPSQKHTPPDHERVRLTLNNSFFLLHHEFDSPLQSADWIHHTEGAAEVRLGEFLLGVGAAFDRASANTQVAPETAPIGFSSRALSLNGSLAYSRYLDTRFLYRDETLFGETSASASLGDRLSVSAAGFRRPFLPVDVVPEDPVPVTAEVAATGGSLALGPLPEASRGLRIWARVSVFVWQRPGGTGSKGTNATPENASYWTLVSPSPAVLGAVHAESWLAPETRLHLDLHAIRAPTRLSARFTGEASSLRLGALAAFWGNIGVQGRRLRVDLFGGALHAPSLSGTLDGELLNPFADWSDVDLLLSEGRVSANVVGAEFQRRFGSGFLEVVPRLRYAFPTLRLDATYRERVQLLFPPIVDTGPVLETQNQWAYHIVTAGITLRARLGSRTDATLGIDQWLGFPAASASTDDKTGSGSADARAEEAWLRGLLRRLAREYGGLRVEAGISYRF